MILAVINHKGGVGKTSVSLNLAATAAMEGYTTCLIDLDPKSDLSKVFLELRESDLTVYDLINYSVPFSECISETSVDNLFIVPANKSLNKALKYAPNSRILFSLKEKLDPYHMNFPIIPRRELSCFSNPVNRFDVIVIDTPPALNLLTTISLVAATHLIIPIHPSYFCLQGINDLLTFYGMIKEKYNSALSLLGCLINNIDFMCDLDKEVEAVLRMNAYNVFSSVIQRNTIIENALISGQSLITYSRDNHDALGLKWEFIEVFREIEERIKEQYSTIQCGR